MALEMSPSALPDVPSRFMVIVALHHGGSRIISYHYNHGGNGGEEARSLKRSPQARTDGCFESTRYLLACYSPFKDCTDSTHPNTTTYANIDADAHILTVEAEGGAGKSFVHCVTPNGEQVGVVAELENYVVVTAIAAGMLHGQPVACLGTASGELLLIGLGLGGRPMAPAVAPLPVVCRHGCHHSGPILALEFAAERVISTSSGGEVMVWSGGRGRAAATGDGNGVRLAWGR